MLRINVISDDSGAYKGVISVRSLIRDYVKGLSVADDAECIEWLTDGSFDEMRKLMFIAGVWGIDFELLD